MSTGALRHSITLESPSTGQDAAGQPIINWTAFATVWADIQFLSGLEVIKSDAPISVVRASARIYYLPGVVANMRFQDDGRVFDVRSVHAGKTDRRFLFLACETGASQG